MNMTLTDQRTVVWVNPAAVVCVLEKSVPGYLPSCALELSNGKTLVVLGTLDDVTKELST